MTDARPFGRIGRRLGLMAVVAGAVLAVTLLAPALGLDPGRLLDRRGDLLAWRDAHPVASLALYGATYVAAMALALPGAAVLSLLGGFLFGPALGIPLVLVAATTGACLVFLLARSALGGPLRRRTGGLPEGLARDLRANGFEYLLFLRLMPIVPFFLVNLAAAVFAVRLRPFLLATILGLIPATTVYVSLGRELGRVADPRDLLSPGVLLALAALGLLALAPVLYRLWRGARRPARRSDPSDPGEDGGPVAQPDEA